MKSNHQGPLRWFPHPEVWVPSFDLNRVSILLGWCETTPQVRGWQSRSTCTDCAVQHAWVNLSPGSVSRGLNIRLRDGWRLTLSVGVRPGEAMAMSTSCLQMSANNKVHGQFGYAMCIRRDWHFRALKFGSPLPWTTCGSGTAEAALLFTT